MRLIWLNLFAGIITSFVMYGSLPHNYETAWVDTLEPVQRELIRKGNWPRCTNPSRYESLDRANCMNSFLIQLKDNADQDAKDRELYKCAGALIIDYSVRRLLIAGCIFAGANPNIGNHNDNPVWIACREQDFALLEFLCSHGADLPMVNNLPTDGYFIPLLSTARKFNIAQFLLNHGLSITDNNKNKILSKVMEPHYAHRLLPLYISQIMHPHILHVLASHSFKYDDNIPALLKKFNAIMTHVDHEQASQLLRQVHPNSNKRPEQLCYNFPASHASMFLGLIMRQKRDLLHKVIEQKKKAHQDDVPFKN